MVQKSYPIQSFFSQAEKLMNNNKFEKAFKVLNNLRKENILSTHDQFKYYLLKSVLLIKLSKFEEALSLVNEIIQKKNFSNYPLNQLDLYLQKIESLWRLGRFNEGLDVIKEGEELLKTLESGLSNDIVSRRALMFYHKGSIFRMKGDYTKALKYHQQALEIQQKLDDRKEIASSLNCIGLIHDLKGDFDKALDYHRQGLNIWKELNNDLGIARSFTNMGIIYLLRGELELALKYFKSGLAIFENIGTIHDTAASLANIGIILCMKGDLNQSLGYHQNSLVLMKKIGNKQNIAKALDNIGSVYHIMGELEEAFKYFQQSLIYQEEIGNKLESSISLFKLILISLDQTDIRTAKYYLQQLKNIDDNTTSKSINQRFRIAKAIVLQVNTQKQEVNRTIKLLDQVSREDIVDHELTILALLHLCNLLLEELKKSYSLKTQKEIEFQITRLNDIAQKQKSDWLLAGTYILKAKLIFIEIKKTFSFEKEEELAEVLNLARELAFVNNLSILLVQGEMLLALFFSAKSLFKEAEEKIHNARKIINTKKMVQFHTPLDIINQKVNSLKEAYLKIIDLSIQESKRVLEQDSFEMQFIESLDEYLRTIKGVFTN